MDNAQDLGAAMAAAAAKDQAKSQEQRIQTLESQVKYLMDRVDELRGIKTPSNATYQQNLMHNPSGTLHQGKTLQQGWYGDAAVTLKY